MPHKIRLLETGFADAYFNMGLDEAILESVSRGDALPTLRFYGWNPKAISIGYFQGARQELDVKACSSKGVDIVRRITGGGAVFHDSELTYSIVIPETHPLARASIIDSYGWICSGLVRGFEILGLKTQFSPINDIVWEGKKISGNAQTRRLSCILQHGTVLLDVDVDEMFSLLLVPKEKAAGKMIADVKERVCSLSIALGRKVGFKETQDAMRQGFGQALDMDFSKEEPRAGEVERACRLGTEKFSSESWIYKR
ncbi:MAG: lipoate-protein ligase A [Spirochaetes bacterium]|nr:MAG: lipoate-protein ligase A [Spirochaetota bacterium]